jgi:uncharacterized DUF497 family protein
MEWDKTTVDQIEVNPKDARRIIIANFKTNLISVLWEKKYNKAVQAISFNKNDRKLVVNIYESSKIDITTLPQDINWIEIEYVPMGKTEFL